MIKIINIFLLLFISHYSLAQLAGERIIKGSERLFEFAKLIGAPYTNLTDSAVNNFDNLETDLMRWVVRDFTEKEINYYITTRIDSSKCRQMVHNAIWNFNRKSYIKSQLYYIKFKHHYIKQYNYHVKFNHIYIDEKRESFFEHLSSNYPELLDSLYQQQYDIKSRSLLNKLNRIAVDNAIYVLGLIDSYKSIPILEAITKDTLMYEKTEIETAKLALARLGNREYEDYILDNLNYQKDTMYYEKNIDIFNKYIYICTQQSAYKFKEFLSYTKDGRCLGFRMFYHIQDSTVWKIRKFIFFHKTIIHPPLTIGAKGLYISQRYLVLEYLIFALKNNFFKEVDFLDGFKVKYDGSIFNCGYILEIDDCVENMLNWLDDNKNNYKLNRRALF